MSLTNLWWDRCLLWFHTCSLLQGWKRRVPRHAPSLFDSSRTWAFKMYVKIHLCILLHGDEFNKNMKTQGPRITSNSIGRPGMSHPGLGLRSQLLLWPPHVLCRKEQRCRIDADAVSPVMVEGAGCWAGQLKGWPLHSHLLHLPSYGDPFSFKNQLPAQLYHQHVGGSSVEWSMLSGEA